MEGSEHRRYAQWEGSSTTAQSNVVVVVVTAHAQLQAHTSWVSMLRQSGEPFVHHAGSQGFVSVVTVVLEVVVCVPVVLEIVVVVAVAEVNVTVLKKHGHISRFAGSSGVSTLQYHGSST